MIVLQNLGLGNQDFCPWRECKTNETTKYQRPFPMNWEARAVCAASASGSSQGRKTQTRRTLKNQLDFEVARTKEWECPYGRKGDRLWVRETIHGYMEHKLPNVPPNDCKTINEAGNYWYAADDEPMQEHTIATPSIFMPRWACRILLEITDVRLERVEDCSEEDAIAEGFKDKADFLSTFYAINPKQKDLNPCVWAINFEVLEENK